MKFLTILACTILPAVLWAQAPAAPCAKPQSFYGAGASYNRAATPNLAGLFVVGVPLTCSDNSFQVYSFTEHNIVPTGVGNNLSFKDTTSSGFATPLKKVGPFELFAFGNIGVTTETGTPSATGSVSLNGAYGSFVAFPLWKKTAWRGLVAAQKVADNNVFSVLIGRAW